MKSLAPMFLIIAVGSTASLTACGDEKCDACPTNPDTHESICAVWNGTYFGHMTTRGGDCGKDQQNLLDGDIAVEVSGIGPDTDGEHTAITIKLTDVEGNWTIFKGQICNTQEETSPKSYSFKVKYSYTDPDFTYQIDNTIDGKFSESDGDSPASIVATYSVFYTDMQDGQNSCDLSADLTANQ